LHETLFLSFSLHWQPLDLLYAPAAVRSRIIFIDSTCSSFHQVTNYCGHQDDSQLFFLFAEPLAQFLF